jgi:SpoVK/Ycf46/Vps4 family AAA+-type ATPase
MLEKMENFSGILFATVNQIQFDEAFFRRFLFRIEIKNPLPETRLQILLHAFPGIDLRVASSISDRYRLTGANIGNIQRKYILLSSGCKDKKIEDCLDDLCKGEVVVQHQRIVISGFQTNKISQNCHLI